jgi:HAD superfamily hydrolase (TIGR01450 family)
MPTVIDLDGVVWLDAEPLPGSADAVAALRSAGHDVWFVTNSSYFTVAEQEDRLRRCGVDAAGRVLTSALAVAGLLHLEECVLVCGGPGLREAVQLAGAHEVTLDGSLAAGQVDTVVVGFTRTFDFDLLTAASTAVHAGARLIGSNIDATHPTPAGLIPGGGALLAAVSTAAGVAPVVAGKPEPAMIDLIRSRVANSDDAGGVVIGDRLDTDGALAEALGWDFVLVRTGVGVDAPPGVRAAADLAEAARVLLG